MNTKLSHIDENGQANMIDVSHKNITARTAIASGKVIFPEAIFNRLSTEGFMGKKGSIIQTAIIAGIQAAKKTAELIPLCHQINLTKIDLQIQPVAPQLIITGTVKCNGQTGVEMEALTAVSVAALTIYDMCKALSHQITISQIQLENKTGGKSDYKK